MLSPTRKPKESTIGQETRTILKNDHAIVYYNGEDFIDAISDSSNDVLATIDNVTLESDNVSSFYNKAAAKHSSIFPIKAPSSQWNKTRIAFALAPVLAIEFARTFATLFMLLNNFISSYLRATSLFTAGVLGVIIIQFVARTMRKSSQWNESTVIKCFLIYYFFLTFSTCLITGMSWSIVSLPYNTTILQPGFSSSHDWIIIVAEAPPLVLSIFLMIGYTLLSATLGAGQYILLSLVSRLNTEVSPQKASSIIVLWTAAGGALAGFIGVIDLVSQWCPLHKCLHHVTANAAVMSLIAICIFVVCFGICACSYYIDAIKRLWERFLIYRERYLVANDTQPNNTAQEDFDECAVLLQASSTSYSSSQFAGSSAASHHTSPQTDEPADKKIYPHHIPVHPPTLKKMLNRKDFVSVSFSILFIFCLSVIFQYYSPIYLSETVFSTNETVTKKQKNYEVVIGKSFVFDRNESVALKLTSAGTLCYNIIFLLVFWKRKWISEVTNSEWKPWLCPLFMMMMFVLTIILVSTDHGAVYLIMCFVFGVVKAMESEMLHTVTRRHDRSWPPVEHDLNMIPRTFIWSLVPISMSFSAILISPLLHVTGNAHIPMFYIIVFSIILAICFSVFRNIAVI